MRYIGVDLGTTGCKCIVFGGGGEPLSQSYFEYDLIHRGGLIEQDADLWWSLVQRAVRESVAACPGGARDVSALAVSSQGISFVPVDETGIALHNAISWLDNRALPQAERIAGEFGERGVFLRTGKRINPCYTLPKLLWMREELPDLYRRTSKFLMGMEYITCRMTGKAVTDYSMASGTMAFDITSRQWDRDLLEACGVDAAKLPDIGCAGSFVGEIQAAAGLGLPEGVKVYLGAQDQKCAAIGAGIRGGVAAVSLGTATAVSMLCGAPVLDSGMRIPCFSLDDNRWILEAVVGTSGASLRWLRDTVFAGADYETITEQAVKSPAGANGVMFFPHLQGATSPWWVSSAAGTLHGLTLATSRADIARAVLEGVAFQIAANLRALEEISGEAVEELRLFGGGAKSALWRRIIADAAGKTVSVPHTVETANLGAAMLAGLGGDALPPPRAVVQPGLESTRRYQDLMTDYFALQERLLNFT